MAGVFVSYRRDDSQGFAGRLADDLIEILGPERVFRDIEIPVGSDFTDVLHRAIAASDILLVVIGRNWAAQSSQGYGSRLFEPADWVRTEIEAAFAQGKQVLPVLVGGAGMPVPGDLPNSIARLMRLQAATLTDRHWDAESNELAEQAFRAAGRGLKKLLSIAFGLGLIYLGIRLFGDENMLGYLDAFEARLQRYVEGLDFGALRALYLSLTR